MAMAKKPVSVLEMNIRRLLKRTEELSGDDSNSSDWNLEKYVKALTEMLSELKLDIEKPSPETLKEYTRRIEFLKKLIESQKIDNPIQKGVALQMMSQGVSTAIGNASREIQQKTTSRYNLDIRNELLGMDKDTFGRNSELRSRKQEKSSGEDLDSLIKYHQIAQEKIVGDMLMLTRDLKEQTKLANNIIKKDVETLQKCTDLTDHNLGKLKIESNRLDEHNKKAWRCWMWILIFVVMIIFIFMVLFMKVTRKKVVAN